jgi:hypothetical protein
MTVSALEKTDPSSLATHVFVEVAIGCIAVCLPLLIKLKKKLSEKVGDVIRYPDLAECALVYNWLTSAWLHHPSNSPSRLFDPFVIATRFYSFKTLKV